MGIVVHDTEGPLDAAIAWFQNPASGVSAHYIIGQDGRRYQMVRNDDVAYHTRGTLEMLPIWMTIMPKPPIVSRPNGYTIGIELELLAEDADGAYSDAQYVALRWLLDSLIALHAIPRNRRRILGHSEIQSDRRDPRGLDWSRVGL